MLETPENRRFLKQIEIILKLRIKQIDIWILDADSLPLDDDSPVCQIFSQFLHHQPLFQPWIKMWNAMDDLFISL